MGAGGRRFAWGVCGPIANALPDGLLIVRGDGSIAAANRRAESLFGAPAGALAARSVEILLPSELRAAHVAHRAGWGASDSQAMSGRTVRARRLDGTEMLVEVGLSRVTLDGVPHVIALVRDVTARVHRELDAVAGEAASFSAARTRAFAHELANALSGVLPNLAFASQEAASLEESAGASLRAALGDACDAVDHAGALVAELREMGAESRSRKLVPVRDVVERAVRIVRPGSPGVRISCETAEAEIEVETVGVVQVLVNLLRNAVDAARAGPEAWVRIAAASAAGGMAIEVSDGGAGVPVAIRSRIFEPHFTTKGAQGTGLGLAVSRRIVQSQGGELDLVADAAHTTFRVLLPGSERPAPPAARATVAPARAGRRSSRARG
jgi:PAS domain S-box-containing protein